MKKIILFALLLSSLPAQERFSNALIHESSPYLQQHAHNPVDWYPWGKEAFRKARREHKLIFLSIGYSTCHWCHVMEKESFTDPDVARLLNENYIAVKVDKEAYPQIDEKYQRLYRLSSGRSGGWPLTVFMTPEEQVFAISTYIPREAGYGSKGLMGLLPIYAKMYREHPEEIRKMVHALSISSKKSSAEKRPAIHFDRVLPEQIVAKAVAAYDPANGGFSGKPKFPEASKLELLLDIYSLDGDPKAKTMVEYTLLKMAKGGIYDQIEGGFFRYTPDKRWEIPHFEKMLYSNAELLALYSRIYRMTKRPIFKRIVVETIAEMDRHFMERNLYFSASDADSAGEEGAYYLYDYSQIREDLQKRDWNEKRLSDVLNYLSIREDGNFDGELSHVHLTEGTAPPGVDALRKSLLAQRRKRTFPFVDRKIITSWNAMMIKALFLAADIDEKYRQEGKSRLDTLLALMSRGDTLFHQVLFGETPAQAGVLEDYAFMVDALLTAYESNYDPGYLSGADAFAKKAIQLFYRGGVWYLDSGAFNTPAESADRHYGAALSVMLEGLLTLSLLNEDLEMAALVRRSVRRSTGKLMADPLHFATLMRVSLRQEAGSILLESTRQNLQKERVHIRQIDYPYLLTKATSLQGWSACRIGSCFAGGADFDRVVSRIEAQKHDLWKRRNSAGTRLYRWSRREQ
jgi:uncharacterized protein YyaL (SSP411 family)